MGIDPREFDMIIVITNKEKNERTGLDEVIVSHGIDLATGKVIILPCATPSRIGATYDAGVGEYVLREDHPK